MAPITLAESLSLQARVHDSLSAVYPQLLTSRSPVSARDTHIKALLTRQSSDGSQPIVVPATYPGSNPGANGGEIAGITLGVVFGIILLIWLISSVLNMGGTPVLETSSVTDPDRYRRRSRSHKTKSTRRTRSRSVVSRSEMSEAMPAPPPARRQRSPRRARETVVIEETRRQPSRPREVVDDDIIEVIEEHSPVRRPRRASGYRNVDPDEYAGGRAPIRKVSRR